MTCRKKKPVRKAAPAVKTPVRKKADIDAAKLMRLLERHALGEIDMTASQVSVALALLKIATPAEGAGAPSHEDALSALA